MCDTAGMVLDRLEEVHSTISRVVWQDRRNADRGRVISKASEAVEALLLATQNQ